MPFQPGLRPGPRWGS